MLIYISEFCGKGEIEMVFNPPKKITVIAALVVVVVGIVLAIMGRMVGAFILELVAAALMLASVVVKGL